MLAYLTGLEHAWPHYTLLELEDVDHVLEYLLEL